MHIDYALIRGCKRFHLTRIRELEMTFPKAVTIISGQNGGGKSSLLHELCPLPAVRTTYEKDGLKEIHLTHDGHSFILKSDFTNRVSPHSFKMDDVELNQGHTTDVQEELVIKYLGLTPAIRNLIYNKTQLCSLTKSERKNLFLTINPMDLSLVMAAHKAAQSRFRDAKAQLQLLHSRKLDLESRMIKSDILAQHKATQEQLTNELNEIDKILYTLEQHVNTLKDHYRDDLTYRQQCVDNNQQLIPNEQILSNCKEILRQAQRFTAVKRGEEYQPAREELRIAQEQLVTQERNLEANIENLTKEINEYQKHLDSASETPVSAIETELADIEKNLAAIGELPETPVPREQWTVYQQRLTQIQELLFVFRDSDVKMLPPEDLSTRFRQLETTQRDISLLNQQYQTLASTVQEQAAELEQHRTRANIPTDCVSEICGLRIIFSQRIKAVEQQYQQNQQQLQHLEQQLQQQRKAFEQERDVLRPYHDAHLLERYQQLLALLETGYFAQRKWREELVERLNTQPLLIYTELEQYLADSKLWYTRYELLQRKQQLTTKLEVLMKSSGASLEFLQNKVKEKEQQLQQHLHQLTQLAQQKQQIQGQYNLYLEYATAANRIQEFQRIFDRGERALIVAKALDYWKEIGRQFLIAKRVLSEELRKLETIVREQEVLQRTYQSETVGLISQIELDRQVYEKIELALSPNTGIPHKSMVRYLNALIHNVNYFLSQVWTYPMKLASVDPDQPLDYGFKIDISGDTINDINSLSEGQSEIINLVWVLTILLQMKMLDKIPLYADELGRAFDATHRMRLLKFLNQLIDNKYIEQLFLVSHYTEFTHGFTDADVIHFGNSSSELPQGVNEHAHFVYS